MKESEKNFLISGNTCYILRFTLYIYSNHDNIPSLDNVDLLNKNNFDYVITKLNNEPFKRVPKLSLINNKIAFQNKTSIREGFVVFSSYLDEYCIKINMKFEKTDDLNNAYSFISLINELSKLKNSYINSKENYDEELKVKYFLKPHINSISHEIKKMYDPTILSYELDNNKVILKNVLEIELLEFARNSYTEDVDDIKIPVSIKNKVYEIHWDKVRELWYLNEPDLHLPQTGNMVIGENNLNLINRNKMHNLNQLERMKKCLFDFKDNLNFPGRYILNNLLYNNDLIIEKIPLFSKNSNSIIKIIQENELDDVYNKMDLRQRSCIEELFENYVISINGKGGSGKTEIGAFMAIFFSLLGKKTLITTETRSGIENFLDRLDKIISKSPRLKNKIKITLFISKNHIYENLNLEKYSIYNESLNVLENIESVINQNDEKSSNYRLKMDFLNIFSNPSVIEKTISLSSNIILSNYGFFSNRKVFNDYLQEFDLNIVDAASSINFSKFGISGIKSKKWVILNDLDQLNPLTTEDYSLKQPIRFPNEEERKHAKKYNPLNQNFKKIIPIWENVNYKKSIASFINQNDKNKFVKFIKLKNQYRIFPLLYQKICKSFEKDYIQKDTEILSFINLNNISPLLNNKNHFSYQIMKPEEIISHMGHSIAEIINSLEKENDLFCPITVGVACTNVYPMRKVFTAYKESRYNKKNIYTISNNRFRDKNNKIDVIFSSIQNHQEKEYDIFILGILKFKSRSFESRIYTALTRASNYAIVYGPNIRYYNAKKNDSLDKNKKILKSLLEED